MLADWRINYTTPFGWLSIGFLEDQEKVKLSPLLVFINKSLLPIGIAFQVILLEKVSVETEYVPVPY